MLRLKGARATSALWAALGCAGIVAVGSVLLYSISIGERVSHGRRAGIAPLLAPVLPVEAPRIRVEVTLAPAPRMRASRAASLYVFVRDGTQGGPPLAVRRLPSRFPQTVELTSADTMIPGHGIEAGEHVQVIARLSPSGEPMDESGDLSGQADYRFGRGGAVDARSTA